MKNELDMEKILSNISIYPDEAVKKAAYERMIARYGELHTENTKNKIIHLSEYELEGIAAAGVLPEDINNIKVTCENENAKQKKENIINGKE